MKKTIERNVPARKQSVRVDTDKATFSGRIADDHTPDAVGGPESVHITITIPGVADGQESNLRSTLVLTEEGAFWQDAGTITPAGLDAEAAVSALTFIKDAIDEASERG